MSVISASTRFTDGPAANVVLELGRSPKLLRAVRDTRGQWDALDQLDDTPQPGEKIVVYRLASLRGPVHLMTSGRGGRRCRWLNMAEYQLAATQPDEATARDTRLWQAWCVAQEPPKLRVV